MSNAKGATIVVLVIIAAFLWATSCQAINKRENCVRDGKHEWVRVHGAQHECRPLSR